MDPSIAQHATPDDSLALFYDSKGTWGAQAHRIFTTRVRAHLGNAVAFHTIDCGKGRAEAHHAAPASTPAPARAPTSQHAHEASDGVGWHGTHAFCPEVRLSERSGESKVGDGWCALMAAYAGVEVARAEDVHPAEGQRVQPSPASRACSSECLPSITHACLSHSTVQSLSLSLSLTHTHTCIMMGKWMIYYRALPLRLSLCVCVCVCAPWRYRLPWHSTVDPAAPLAR